ncbi:MAG TPA: glycosyltransferase [Terriglobia bacterium]|nr:glycosyltransferase [Terriglobia bacterium]
MIPKILHYCFGMSANSGRKPWSLVHYACLRSAVERLKPADVLFHCESEPEGPWWELTRPLVTLNRIKAPREIFENPLVHEAHRADVVRLEKLLASGGIYLDPDVFVHRSFDDLLGHATVMGEERADGKVVGLCNAVILAEAEAPFVKRWRSEYSWFRSRGQDGYWDEHSVQLPYRLAQQFPGEVTVLPDHAFFWPSFKPEDLKKIFATADPIDVSRSYAVHLWAGLAWDNYLEHLTPGRARKVDSNFHRWVRPMVAALPDDYGAPGIKARLARGVRHVRRRVGAARARMRQAQSPA